jgi:transcriptional regulator with XRE-family HTH domain
MPHPADIHVGKRLRLRRTILGLSQEAIGKAIGVTFQQVQKYERGVNRMGSSRLYEFSKILSVPVSYFFEEMDKTGSHGTHAAGVAEDAPAFEHEKMSSRETLEMMRAYYRITDPHVRKRVFELIKSIADDKPVE